MKHPSIAGASTRYETLDQHAGEVIRLFAIQTHDTEMSPRFKAGEIAVFNKEAIAEPGDDVVIHFTDGCIKVRGLADADDLTVTLRTYSPDSISVVSRERIKGVFPIEARYPARDWSSISGLCV